MYINNMDELEKALQPTMQKMVDGMANRVYETLNFFLQRYYDSYDPIYYRRQYDFLRSGFKVDARIIRGKAVASVYIDVDYMSNYYGVNALGAKSDYEGINWATKYLASISAVDDAYKKVINLTEDYRDTVDSLAESLVSAEDKLADKNRDQGTKEHERDEKKWAYTDDSKSDRLATITANLLSDRTNYESYFTQADKRKSQAAEQAQQVWNRDSQVNSLAVFLIKKEG